MNRLIILAVMQFCTNKKMFFKETIEGLEINTNNQNSKLKRYCKKNAIPLNYEGSDNYKIKLNQQRK